MSAPELFPYPPLPPSTDAIRILTVLLGDFAQPLQCTLTTAPFRTKPRYAALSYTWGLPHPDLVALSHEMSTETPELFILTINGHAFPVHANLALCLLHLRSTTHPFPLWVDALCINQADVAERNAQVALMSFIYSRARMTVAWLAIREITPGPNNVAVDAVTILGKESDPGAVKQLAALAVDGQVATHFRSSPAPGRNTFDFLRIASSAYWTRLWIVQEVCLAREVALMLGGKAWLFDEAVRWELLGQPSSKSLANAMLRLVEARLARHTDAMRFESLVQRFADQARSETRDGVYALLGVAHDIRASAGGDHPQTQPLGMLEPKRGTGTLRVDYSRSHYDIWADTVRFVYFQARRMDALFAASEFSPLAQHERAITIVRTAAAIQKALHGKAEPPPPPTDPHPYPSPVPVPAQEIHAATIPCLGYLAGRITHLGPSYASLVGSFAAEQSWQTCCEAAYSAPSDLERIRALSAAYLARIIEYTDGELRRIRAIPSRSRSRSEVAVAIAWQHDRNNKYYSEDRHRAAVAQMCKTATAVDETARDSDTDTDTSGEATPRMCIGTTT